MEPQQQYINPAPSNKRSGRTKLALWLMIGPTALLITSFVLFAVLNVIFGAVIPASTPTEGQLFGEPSLIETISNVIMFLIGTLSIVAFLPGLIIGIVLLATRK